ncbi:MAG TPA: HlyD family efflux transporter periplasmic adaptor subunit [Steroidobacteraceae bacterium]|nr:HlyD family efflux transporter periplasmic adaptor subunit [Steroidobacteraceae bacterium]
MGAQNQQLEGRPALRTTLFRSQALEHHKPTLIGAALKARPLSFPILTSLAVGAAALVILFGCWGQYTRKARVVGYLAPSTGLIKVFAPMVGTLIEKRVSEGQHVHRGDVLFLVSMDQASMRDSQVQASTVERIQEQLSRAQREREAQAQVENGEAQARKQRVHSMTLELTQLDAGIEVQKTRANSTRAAADRYNELFDRHLITRLDVERAESDALEQLARLHEMERSRTALERELDDAKQALAASQFETEKHLSELERQELTLEQQLSESDSHRVQVITAPADGVVTAITGERGLTTNPQIPLLAILPSNATLQARLLAPSRAIGTIAVGDQVSLRYQAFPYQRYGVFTGTITEISKTLLAPEELDGPIKANEPAYRVTVALADQSVRAGEKTLPLQPGMQLDADILLERRRLITWFVDPLFSIARDAR